MNLFFDIPLSSDEKTFNTIIEIPKHSRVKYEYNEKLGVIAVDRVFRTPVDYPQNYGFFPRTWNKFDNDPMDVIIISSEKFFPGVVVPVRIIGIIEMDDTGELDHKILAVPEGHSDYEHCKDIDDLDSEIVENLEWFLTHYKDREPGKKVVINAIKGSADAIKFLNECSKEFKQKHQND